MFRKYDYVRIVDYPERQKGDLEQLIGKEAMIIDIDRKYDYPYEVCFLTKRHRIWVYGMGIYYLMTII